MKAFATILNARKVVGMWVLMTTLGLTVASAVAFGLGSIMTTALNFANVQSQPTTSSALFRLVITVVGYAPAGIILGLAQSLEIRHHVRKIGLWIGASALGLALSAGVAALMLHVTDGLLGSVFAGTVFGVAQWLVLKRYIRQSVWWIVASIAGFTVNWVLYTVMNFAGIANLLVQVVSPYVGYTGALTIVSATMGMVFGVLLGIPTSIVLAFFNPNSTNAMIAMPMNKALV